MPMRSGHPGPPWNPLLCCRSLAGAVSSGLTWDPLGRCLAGLACVKDLKASLWLDVWQSAALLHIPTSSPAELVQGTGLFRIGLHTFMFRYKSTTEKRRSIGDWAPGRSPFFIPSTSMVQVAGFLLKGVQGETLLFSKRRVSPASPTPQSISTIPGYWVMTSAASLRKVAAAAGSGV